jgi:hypothetical protein
LTRESRRLIDKMGIADKKNCGGEQHSKALADATHHFTLQAGRLLF